MPEAVCVANGRKENTLKVNGKVKVNYGLGTITKCASHCVQGLPGHQECRGNTLWVGHPPSLPESTSYPLAWVGPSQWETPAGDYRAEGEWGWGLLAHPLAGHYFGHISPGRAHRQLSPHTSLLIPETALLPSPHQFWSPLLLLVLHSPFLIFFVNSL